MKLTLIRNATLRLAYAGHTLVVDPYLAAAHTLPAYAGRSKNPLIDLPYPASNVLDGAEMVIVSHTHTDHFDPVAQKMLFKTMPIFCQPANLSFIMGKGFTNVTAVEQKVTWEGITIHRTEGRHGSSNAVLSDMGVVSGFILRAAGEPSLYLAGDTVWYAAVAQTISKWQPDVIVTHSGGAMWGNGELIVMDAAQTAAVCQHAPRSKIIAVHLEALDHCTVTRPALRATATKEGISAQQLLIPADGQTLELDI